MNENKIEMSERSATLDEVMQTPSGSIAVKSVHIGENK
jgi:hypothetical protein